MDVSVFQNFKLRLAAWEWWVEQFKTLVSMMNADHGTGQVFGELLVKHLIASLILDGNPLTWKNQNIDSRVLKALELVESRYADSQLAISELAEVTGLSPSRFRALFMDETGHSPRNYLMQVRLRKAMDELRHTGLPIKEIAAEAGFNDVQYFYRTFRKACGRTPSEYRCCPVLDS